MTSASDSEPTLRDLSNKLDQLSSDVETFSGYLKKFDERFADYLQAAQWVVHLAFTLIASATLTVIITSVLRR
jgi:hypothetical protein